MTVVALPKVKKDVHESVVRVCKRALELAESGDLIDVVVVGDAGTEGMWIHSSEAANRFQRIGHMAYALVTLVTEIHKREGDEK